MFTYLYCYTLCMTTFEAERAYVFTQVLSVRLKPFRFWSITREHLDLPSSNMSHTSILGSRGTLSISGSKVKVTKVKCSKTISNCLWNDFPKWISSSYMCATYFELTYPVVQTCDQKTTLGRLYLPSSNLVHTSILGSRGTLMILGLNVKVTKVKCSKTLSNCLSLNNTFPKWISSSYICATYFERTYAVWPNICDKKSIGGIMFYEHLLFALFY